MDLELGRVTDRKPPFKFSSLTRVGFSDTDAQGIVYYGRYFPYFDVARVEYFRHLHLLYADFEGDAWHFNVRPSNTEPLLRLNLEARSKELMERKRDEVLEVIRT